MAILFPYFELAASLFILLLIFHIYIRHYENRTARFYARFGLVAFLACIFTYSYRIAFTLEIARDLNRLSATFFAFTFSMYAHFVLIFTKKERILKNKLTLFALYLPPTLLAGLFIFTNLMYSRYEILSYGIAGQPAWLYVLFIAQTAFYTLGGIVLLLIYSKRALQKTLRMQALFIAVGSIISVSVGVLTDEILPLALGGRIIFPTAIFDIAVLNLFIYLAMRHYSLFAISPALAANTIIETMPDALIVTDLAGRVLLLNEEAHKYFHAPKEEILGKNIRSLFEDKEGFYKLYDDTVKKGMEVERFEAKLYDPLGECLPSFINANALRDEAGALLGIVFVIRDIRG